MEADQVTRMVWSSVQAPKLNKHVKKAKRHIGQNIVNITMKTIVWKPWVMKNIKLCLKNSDN